MEQAGVAHYHLPGLFEFYELYRVFLPLFREHREYFYDWCDIGSIYGAPAFCAEFAFCSVIDAFLYGKTSPYPGRLMRRFVRKP